MTAPDRHTRFAATRRAVRLIGLVVVIALGGCKSRDTGGWGSGPSRERDPLVVGPGRIPKQNLPVPGRGGTAGAKGRSDPLLGSPTGRTADRAGAGYTDDPDRWRKGPYVPGPGGTPASLAGRTPDDGDGLKIESPGGVPLTPAGGLLPGRDVGGGADPLYAELAKFGVNRGDYGVSREGGRYVVRVRAPNPETGAFRGYTGVGTTEAAAVKQILDQIKLDIR